MVSVLGIVAMSMLHIGSNCLDPPKCNLIKGLVASTRWYLGGLQGQLGGAGVQVSFGSVDAQTPAGRNQTTDFPILGSNTPMV